MRRFILSAAPKPNVFWGISKRFGWKMKKNKFFIVRNLFGCKYAVPDASGRLISILWFPTRVGV